MNVKNVSNQNKEDNLDSDIESRLYAEIYYANTIIGDENNLSISNNDNGLLEENVNDSLNRFNPDINTCTTNYVERHLGNAVADAKYISINNAPNTLNIETLSTSKSKHSYITQNRSNSKQLNKESLDKNEPSLNYDNNLVLNQISKKRKTCSSMDSTNDTQVQENRLNILDTNSINPTTNCKNNKQNDLRNSKNTIVNPYNKQVASNSKVGLGLLSAEFINLLFGKSTKKTTYAQRRKLRKNEIKKKSHLNSVTQENEFIKSTTFQNDGKNVQNNEEDSTQINLFNASEIIDISSESSLDDNSKYTTIATDKKLTTKGAKFKDIDSEISTSDSEESIFEVPVPPKPAPPLIELKDSDKESSSESESSSFSSNSQSQNSNQESLNTVTDAVTVTNINFQSTQSDSLILNCTEIQKGAASFDEIKKMNKQSLNTKEPTKHADSCNVNMCNIENVQNLQCESNISTINTKDIFRKKVSSNLTMEENTTHNKLKEHFFPPMNNRMKSFYNDSWGGENFDLEKLKCQMSTDPNKWAILDDDLVISLNRRKRYFGIVCNRCQKDGHRQNNCPEPFKFPVCHMCGEKGHSEINCPDKICLTCGKKQNMYSQTCDNCKKLFCTRCKSRGHLSYSCPDLWRRYHHTIKNINVEAPKILKVDLKPTSELFCCNCAKRGHDSFNCRKFRWSQHFPNPPQIINYNGPTYHNENYDPSSNIYNIHENSFHYNTSCDLTNFTKTSNNQINSNELDQAAYITRRKENSFTQNNHNYLQDYSKDVALKVIFKIHSKIQNMEIQNLQSSVLKLNISGQNVSSSFENWIDLWSFLKSLVSEFPSHFLLTLKNNQLKMNIKCPKKFTDAISKLIHLYAERTNYERSLMYMNPERNMTIVINHLSTKLVEMRKLNEDPLQLHEKILELTRELSNQDQAMNERQISLRVKQLTHCKEKLLIALYREGCADESLEELKKIYIKLLDRSNSPRKRKKKGPPLAYSLISFQCLFKYLYYYNNVFVPYELKKLPNFINKYKNYVEIRNNFKSNPLLVQQEHNHVMELLSTSQASSILLSTNTDISQIPSLLSLNSRVMSDSNLSQTTCNVTNTDSTDVNDIQYIPLEKSKKFNLKKKPNGLYMQLQSCKKEKKRKKFENRFKNFIKETKNLLIKAHQLNAPHLQNYINILENKMKNEIYVHKHDVKPLKTLVEKELKKKG